MINGGLRQASSIDLADREAGGTPGLFLKTPDEYAIAESATCEEAAEQRRRRGRAGAYTGPRTSRGKRRSSLNRLKRGLCPGWVEQELRARAEDPEAFRRLHRDLMGWLGPEDARSRVVVETLAEAWWEKMRRVRNWVAAGAPDTREDDARIDDLLQRFVWALRCRHRKWRCRLESAFGKGLSGPAILRQRMEARIPALGGKPPARRRSAGRDSGRDDSYRRDPWRDFEETLAGLRELLAMIYPAREAASGGRPNEGGG